MMVIFTSKSEKKALVTTRNILDNFAERIGDNTWKTIITQDGLSTLHGILRRHATKSMAVSCHWIRSRYHSELVWIVGNRSKFNSSGISPIASTAKDLLHSSWENNWIYMPHIKSLAALAGLLHDWGKASDLFQDKLRKTTTAGDPFRHEWVSCKLIEGLVSLSGNIEDDSAWLELLQKDKLEDELMEAMTRTISERGSIKVLPPIATLLVWLILSHHRLPDLKSDFNKYAELPLDQLKEVLALINADWGYSHGSENKDKCFSFSQGLLFDNGGKWRKEIKKWSTRLLSQKKDLLALLEEGYIEAPLRLILSYSRLSLMLGDHYISSLPPIDGKNKASSWTSPTLWANTDGKEIKQFLEEHLVGVSEQAARIAHNLPYYAESMESVHDLKTLDKRSPFKFEWQDKVVSSINDLKKGKQDNLSYFVVNMASTGCGKTFANAKIMKAISSDNSLRYILALGLRTLTLQTGDEYKEKIGLLENDLAVLIGSKGVKDLHDLETSAPNEQTVDDVANLYGSPEALLPEDLQYTDTFNEGQHQFMKLFFSDTDKHRSEKNKAFLYKPVLVTTIDHLMSATEAKRGGRYILPYMRLMSTDLVIDEIDDFSEKDIVAISRVVHLAGMLGRNIVLSSATMPPDLIKGLFIVYHKGMEAYNKFFGVKKIIASVTCDEFTSKTTVLRGKEWLKTFEDAHKKFIERRVKNLDQQYIKRKAKIISIDKSVEAKDELVLEKQYFSAISSSIIGLHDENHIIDKRTGKKISFGLIRVANISPCVKLSLYLLKCAMKDNYAIRVMTYHSRQVLLLRHEQERYLDAVLCRKGQNTDVIDIEDKILRAHIDKAKEEHILFVLVATPVEEVGRDHDFDWALVEPSSYRSIVQLAGRVKRHREINKNIEIPNIGIMELSLRAFKEGHTGKNKAFYNMPGYERAREPFKSHYMQELLDDRMIDNRIDATSRIYKPKQLLHKEKMVDLEHHIFEEFANCEREGPRFIHGWLDELWWLTALPQRLNPFRESHEEDLLLWRVFEDDKISFKEYDKIQKRYKEIEVKRAINSYLLEEKEYSRLWLSRDYRESLLGLLDKLNFFGETEEDKLREASIRFGEISFPNKEDSKWLYSDNLGLFKKPRTDLRREEV